MMMCVWSPSSLRSPLNGDFLASEFLAQLLRDEAATHRFRRLIPSSRNRLTGRDRVRHMGEQ